MTAGPGRTPNPNSSAIQWRDWCPEAFREAADAGRPVLLNLTAFWCDWCRLMEETTYSDSELAGMVNDTLVPVRVDADRHPHVQDRYIAGGWPTTAFLTPTGEVLWAGTYMDADQFRTAADSVLGAWHGQREQLEQEIGRRRRAAESTRGRGSGSGLVRREPADDVLTAARHDFDARHGGVGTAPKFPLPELIELLYVHGHEDAGCATMADQTLDGMLAGELWDPVEGGFFRYATAADWTEPRYEKLLEVNAGLLDAYALGASMRRREDWRDVAERTVAWVEAVLAMDGLWASSQRADAGYFAADATARSALTRPAVDDTVYASANARWIGALAMAGARLDRDDWIARADAALRQLLRLMAAPNGGVFHYRPAGMAPQLEFLLLDTLACARAALALAQATGASEWLDTARGLARHLETRFWRDEGGFSDRIRSEHDIGMLRYADQPFEANAAAARLLLDLGRVGGERRWRALAERTLASIGPLAGRFGTAAALFALATEEFFEPPPSVFIAVPTLAGARAHGADAAAALRRAGFSLPVAALRVWTVPADHAVGPQRFPALAEPVAYVWTRRGCAGPIALPEQVTAASATVL
jgi:uncharacterized protein